jgi:hypothetical protein
MVNFIQLWQFWYSPFIVVIICEVLNFGETQTPYTQEMGDINSDDYKN